MIDKWSASDKWIIQLRTHVIKVDVEGRKADFIKDLMSLIGKIQNFPTERLFTFIFPFRESIFGMANS